MYKKLIAPISLLIGALYLYFGQIPKIDVMSPGSHSLLLPKILLVLLIVLSGLELIKIILVNQEKLSFKMKFDSETKKLIISFLLCVGYLYGITIIGYFFLTPIFLFIFIRLLGKQKLWLTSIVSLGITGVVYFIFIKLLYIPLPQGIGIFKSLSEFIIY